MSLEQPEEDLRFIFPVLPFIRVWDKGSTSHIYNEPLLFLFSLGYRILCDDEESQAWSEMAARYLMMTMMTVMTPHPIRVTICPWQLAKVRPVLAYPCSATLSLRTTHYILTQRLCVLRVSREVSPGGWWPGRAPECPAPWPLTTPDVRCEPLASSDGSQPRLSFDGNLSPGIEIFRAKSPSRCPRPDKKALIKAIKMNGRPLSTRSDIVNIT